MNWEAGSRYRGIGVQGQIAIKVNPKTKTAYVEALVEASKGPMVGQRIRYRGYLNTERNVERTVGELRAMGVRSQKIGDFSGFGSREFQFTSMADAGDDGKTYWRAAFVQDVPTLSDKNRAESSVIDALNAKFGEIMIKTQAAPKPVETSAADAFDDPPEPAGTAEIPF